MRLPSLTGAGRRRQLAVLGMLGLVEGAALLGLSLLGQHAIDSGVSFSFLAFSVALVAVAAAARVEQRGLGENLAQRYVRRVRERLLNRWLTASPRERAGMNRGALLLRVMGDMTAIGRWLSRGLGRLVSVIPVIALLLGALVWLDLRVGLVAALVLGAGIVASWAFGGPVEERVRQVRRRRGQLAARASEAVEAASDPESSAALVLRVDRLSRRLRAASVAAARSAGILEALVLATTAGAMLSVLVVGASAGSRVSTGWHTAAMMIVGLLSRPVHELGRIHDTWRRYRVARSKVEAFLVPQLRALPGGRGDGNNAAAGGDGK